MTAGSDSATPLPAYLELGARRVFACVLDWPGWCRSGKDEERALEALAAAAPRYALVAAEAGYAFPTRAGCAFDVVERVPGSGTTDFGEPGAIPSSDREPLGKEEAERLAALVAASWRILDRVVAAAPAVLRKGPRGGGRDRDAVASHLLASEVSYARTLGVRLGQPAAGDDDGVAVHRGAIVEALSRTSDGTPAAAKGWPPRYAARRIAWHVLDHAWEIEDRTPGP